MSIWRLAEIMLCAVGLHPASGRLMRTGQRQQGRSVVAWECRQCGRHIGETSLPVNVRLLRRLRQQVGISRRRSRLIRLVVVEKGRDRRDSA